MKKHLLLLAMILLPMVANADAVEINGIYYNLSGTTAEVTSNPNKYTGDLMIPETVTFQDVNYTVSSIGKSAFAYCKDLNSVFIRKSVVSIGANAFQGCNGLYSVSIPNSVTSIGSNAFRNCPVLSTVRIFDIAAWCNIEFQDVYSNPLISAHFFYVNGKEIKDLVIPNSVTSIGDYAFYNCPGITSVDIPNSVTSIGAHAFSFCRDMTSVIIPNSVTSIGNCAFEGCSGLISVIIPKRVTSIGQSAFSGCSGLTSVTIPNSVTSIEYGAFQACYCLTSVTIPNSVTSIGESAFNHCSGLTSVSIGNGIKTIENYAFAYCPELGDVYCHAVNTPDTKPDVFKDSYIEHATLHVPVESVNAYKAVDPWKNFKNIVDLEGGDTPEPQKCEKPTISYNKGQLKFASATDGAECVTNISDADIKTHYGNEISLTATYNISVYATKEGYDNSDVATATLCWIDKDPTTEGITDGVSQIPSKAVLIQSEGGILKVEGVDDGTQVAVYTPDGKQAGNAVCRNGAALVGTSILSGNTAIVKIGERVVKFLIK